MGNKGSRKKKNKDKKKEEEEKAAENNKAAAEGGGQEDNAQAEEKKEEPQVESESPSPTPTPSPTVEEKPAENKPEEKVEVKAPSPPPQVNIVSTEFKWDSEGDSVQVTGAWNNWQDKITLEKKDDTFIGTIDLPPGEYLYKFIVDDQTVVSKSLPTKSDDEGNENNVIVVG